MDAIFHEKQDGALCAQHCLNALFQGPYFTAVDLAAIARHLDEEERLRMAEGDVESEEYKNFLKQPSSNMDDSGFFSVQVLSHALQVWGLKLVPYLSPDVKQARENPQYQDAFICNLQQHWLTIRKLGNQWFNLNSLLAKPSLISCTYLGMFLTQLQTEGYSIFVVVGDLPKCEAQELLKLCPVEPQALHPSTSAQSSSSHIISKGDLVAALRQASAGNKKEGPSVDVDVDVDVDVEDLRRKRQLHFAKKLSSDQDQIEKADQSQQKTFTEEGSSQGCTLCQEMTEEEMLAVAVKMSLEEPT